MRQFENVGLGGTFDRLHMGHKLFLDIAAHYGQNVHVGLISPSYLDKIHKNYSEIIQSFQVRRIAVETFFSKRKTQCQITRIENPGMDRNLASDAKLGALIVSQETCSGANTINRLRTSKGKSKLTIIIVPRVVRTDGSLESSTRLRKEEHEKSRS
ncbi:MAG: pantetheine-phosphate adenylyltransferase [Candidatus Heimdallarchaeota archaeon]|nr:MAG: pantetheine-phosphate adenylyltransferase [Candidatus Heimdallarchaeota archaeon]